MNFENEKKYLESEILEKNDFMLKIRIIFLVFSFILVIATIGISEHFHNKKLQLEEMKLNKTLKNLKEARFELTSVQKEAVTRGYATIDPETKEFKWKR